MEFVFITPSIKTGGGNRVFIELANKIAGNNDVKIIYPNNCNEKHTFQVEKQVEVKGIGSIANTKPQKLINIFKTIIHINKHHKSGVIIVSDPILSLLTIFIKNARIYRFIQADDYRIFDDGALLGKGIILSLYKKACLISYKYQSIKYIFNSRFVFEQFISDSRRKDIPFKLVHPAIDHNTFKNRTNHEHNNHISICLVARKHPFKGFETFSKAFKILPEEYKSQIHQIRLISHDDLSDFDTTGMNIIKPTSDRDISETYKQSDLFISTSWQEGFGLPPLEAMASGCACIISSSGGVNEYAINGENCLMFTPKDEIKLAEHIKTLIEEKKLRKILSENGIKKASLFSWDKSFLQLMAVIE